MYSMQTCAGKNPEEQWYATDATERDGVWQIHG